MHEPASSRSRGVRFWAAAAALAFAAGGAGGWYSVRPGAGVAPGEVAAVPVAPPDEIELLALLAEAESLAAGGRLADAHAVYRRLAGRIVGRQFRGRTTWDLPERAKAQQDRVYWLLLTRTRGADLAFFKGSPDFAEPRDVMTSGRRIAQPATAGSPGSPADGPARPIPPSRQVTRQEVTR